MVYVIAIILGVSLAYVSFMAGSYHGYGKALEDMEELIARKDENNE